MSWKVFVEDKDSDSWFTAQIQSNLVANTKRVSVRKADGHFDVVDSCFSEYRRSGWNSAEDRACFFSDAFLHAGHTVISYPSSGGFDFFCFWGFVHWVLRRSGVQPSVGLTFTSG